MSKDQEITIKIAKPFGPSMAFVKLPETVLNGLREVSSKILNNPKRESYGANLAGAIEEEPIMVESDFINAGAKDVIEQSIYKYVIKASENRDIIKMKLLCKAL